MLKILFIALIIGTTLSANESSLFYAKLGATNPPADSIILPTLGIGARFQRDKYGFDLSANVSTLVFINYASLKGVFLFYPYPKAKHQLYFGMGPGIAYYLKLVPVGQPFGSASTERGFLTLEGILGYEFRHSDHFKTFIQLEPSFSHRPGIALTVGMGF